MFKTNFLYSILIIAILALTVQKVNAQQGIGTDLPSRAAALEIKSGSKGILIPRIALTDTHTFINIISGAQPGDPDFEEKTNSLLVYNTETQNDVTPGFYYWTTADGGKWNRIANFDDIGPWYSQDTGFPTTENQEDIYQMGHVAIGKDDDFIKVALDVYGSIRGGDITESAAWPINIGQNSIAVGKNPIALQENSVAFGRDVVASGKNSQAFGAKSQAMAFGAFAGGGYQASANSAIESGGSARGKSSFAFGRQTDATGDHSVSFGRMTKALGEHSIAMGYKTIANNIAAVAFGSNNKAMGDYSFVMGRYAESYSSFNTVFGQYNAIHMGEKQKWIGTDPIFEIGIGDGYFGTNPRNALTVLKNGRVGIGIKGVDSNAKPTEILDIGSSNEHAYEKLHKVKIRDLPKTDGNHLDQIVTVDDSGVLRSVDASIMGLGQGSGAFGRGQADGTSSFALMENTTAQGDYAVHLGAHPETNSLWKSEANGKYTLVVNRSNTADGEASTASGYATRATGDFSFSMGESTQAGSSHELVIGRYNKIDTGQAHSWNDKDPVFQIGIGTDPKAGAANALTVLKSGWTGIGYYQPSGQGEKLRVDGGISATNVSFPDYVFQTYFDGTSELKPDYRFKDLGYIKSFLKENKHLPGILPASALERNQHGHYEFNLSRLSVQNLEKIEELYLHTLEQEEKIENQEAKIETLENEVAELKQRLRKLEKILNPKE